MDYIINEAIRTMQMGLILVAFGCGLSAVLGILSLITRAREKRRDAWLAAWNAGRQEKT